MRRHVVLTSTDNQEDRRTGRCSSTFQAHSTKILSGSRKFVIFCVDDFTRKKSNGVEDLRGIINEDIAPQGTDGGGEFDGQFNPFLPS